MGCDGRFSGLTNWPKGERLRLMRGSRSHSGPLTTSRLAPMDSMDLTDSMAAMASIMVQMEIDGREARKHLAQSAPSTSR